MDKWTIAEEAYKNGYIEGYKKGYAEGFAECNRVAKLLNGWLTTAKPKDFVEDLSDGALE